MTSIISNTRIFKSSRLGLLTFLVLLLSTSLTTQSCKTFSVPFSAESLAAAKNLKLDVVKLMGNATNNYNDHESDITTLTKKVNDQIAKEEERNVDNKNKQTVEMYKLMMNPEKNLLGGFLKRWKSEGKLSSFFVDEAKKQISSNFDKIINLENNKKR